MEKKRCLYKNYWVVISSALILSGSSGVLLAAEQATSYKKVAVEKSFDEVKQQDVADKPNVMKRHKSLLERRYELQDQPSKTVTMSAGKPVQEGIRVKLPQGITWEQLSEMSAQEIKQRDLFPKGFRPLPHPKHSVGGQVYPPNQIEAIQKAESRDLSRFDVEFDLPDRFLPEFPPPIYLTTHPALGDVSQGEVLTIKNYYRLLNGIITPVQMEGLRLLLTPFPQQEFNQTEDRKVKEPTLGVTCLDCHVNGHTNAAFHLNPDTRPQKNRFRLDTVSLRGMYNQQIHGSKRSLRSVEDFTQFEQRTAYFDGDHVIAAKKGVHLPNRTEQVSMMAQMQNMFDFPPAPKLDATGRLMSEKASEEELRGENIFFGKGKCSTCHIPPAFLDHQMHDLHLERFYEPEMINSQYNVANGPIKTFTLRGIKDSPPYLADGRLLTLADTVEFFNLVLQLDLTSQEKEDLLSYLYTL
ncbi:cytochrome b6 [Nitrosococcus oceani]|uniref:Cytochrome c Hsc n=2 Tax=Nitrosococcus oceani TaxID=1229 RepID=Q3JDT5_NITOC|nr:cytochrome b6 [Nitrosococcus oceani]ABA57011.1 cytochrome c Hsc [Nitrosococcus oceani ATCC 19707]KFI20587.1 cytochrome B6 [Nitrosococcus oceani C-27]KFI23668.1 cytochrome B6 [Nitrosococcus oceani]GEM20936.1 cytochrome b6 [Nitrosococcus oceani]